jgi:hypothetical protein
MAKVCAEAGVFAASAIAIVAHSTKIACAHFSQCSFANALTTRFIDAVLHARVFAGEL